MLPPPAFSCGDPGKGASTPVTRGCRAPERVTHSGHTVPRDPSLIKTGWGHRENPGRQHGVTHLGSTSEGDEAASSTREPSSLDWACFGSCGSSTSMWSRPGRVGSQRRAQHCGGAKAGCTCRPYPEGGVQVRSSLPAWTPRGVCGRERSVLGQVHHACGTVHDASGAGVRGPPSLAWLCRHRTLLLRLWARGPAQLWPAPSQEPINCSLGLSDFDYAV